VRKLILIGLIPILFILAFPLAVAAAGLGVGPAKIEISDALRGGEYKRTISIKYIGEGESILKLNAAGDVSDWVSFYERGGSTTPIESVTALAGEWTYAIVQFNIPDDCPVGSATGTLYVESVPPEDSEHGGVTVGLQGKVDVSITVTGTQILAGDVTSISATDIEVGYPLRVDVHFRNTGNVVATPQVDVAITKDGAAIGSFTFAETEVKPESSETICVEWDTADRELGEYLADVAVSLRDVIATQELTFDILPFGTLSREGVLTELSLEGNAKLGAIAKIQATFANTGQIATKAKFIGEAYCDNELVDTLESEETLIPVGQEETLMSYIKLESPGNYDIKGYINYEGKKTEVKEISFAVGEAGGGLPFSLSTPLIGVIVVLVAVIAFLALRRRRKPA